MPRPLLARTLCDDTTQRGLSLKGWRAATAHHQSSANVPSWPQLAPDVLVVSVHVNQSEAYVKTPNTLFLLPQRSGTSAIHTQRALRVQDCHCCTTWPAKPCYLWHMQLFLVNRIRRTRKPSITLCLCLTHAPPGGEHHISRITMSDLRSESVRPKPGKIPLPGPGTAGLADPNLVPDLGPDGSTRIPGNSVAEFDFCSRPLTWRLQKQAQKMDPFLGAPVANTGPEKGSAWVAPWIPRSPVNALFSTTPPISTPQQLSSDIRRRYTHCNASLGNSHKAINQSEAYVKIPNTLFLLPQRSGTSAIHTQRALRVQDCHCYTTWLAKPCYLWHMQLFLVNRIRRTRKPSITPCLCLTHAPPGGEHHISRITMSDLRSESVRPKPGKIPLPGPGAAGLADPNLVPDLGPDGSTRIPGNSVAEFDFCSRPLTWRRQKQAQKMDPFLGEPVAKTGPEKGSAWVAPWISRSPVNTLFSTTPPISTPQQLSSDIRRRYTHCNASLGNSHKAINQSEAYVKIPNTLFLLPQRSGTSAIHTQRALRVQDCHWGGPLLGNGFLGNVSVP